MADRTDSSAKDSGMPERWRDMGDGTWARVMVPLPAAASQSLTASSGVVANAVATATFPAVPGFVNWVTGFSITGLGATLGSGVVATLSGLAGGGLSYASSVVSGVLLGNPGLFVTFPQPIPASAANTAISLAMPALGAGNTSSVVNLHGFKLPA